MKCSEIIQLHDNPLSQTIFECLLQTSHWKIHTLATYLCDNHHIKQLDLNYDKNIFKKNFIIMNALYQLDDELSNHGYSLIIETLDIRLTKLSNTLIHSNRLKNYYLNWHNFNTDIKEINALLDSFWQSHLIKTVKYSHTKEEVDSAFSFFDLPKNATAEQITKQWKALALKFHPDKTSGNKSKFQQLQAQWQVLKTTFR